MERVLFAKDPKSKIESSYFRGNVDEVWYVPQQGHQNHDYYRILNGLEDDKVFAVPFIWDPIITENLQKTEKIPNWTPRDTRRISIMEPNLSLMKNCVLPITYCNWFLEDGERIDHIYSWSTQKLSTSKRLIKIIQHGKPELLKILSAEDRRPTLRVLNNHAKQMPNIFFKMFDNTPETVIKFLSNKSNIFQDLLIILKMPKFLFIKALLK